MLLSSVNPTWTPVNFGPSQVLKNRPVNHRKTSYDFLHKSNEDNCRYELNSWHYLPKHHESKTKWCKIPFSFTFPREILNAVDRPMLKQRKFLTLKGYGKKFLLKFFVKFLYFTEVIYYPLIYSPFQYWHSISSRFHLWFLFLRNRIWKIVWRKGTHTWLKCGTYYRVL